MRKIRTIIISVLLVAATVPFVIAGVAQAVDNNMKDHVWIKDSGRRNLGWLKAGDHYEGKVPVHNTFSTDRLLKVVPTPYTVGEGEVNNFTEQKVRTSLAKWISLPGGNEYMLKPDERRDIIYHVDVPRDWTTGGGQSAAINFDYGGTSTNDGLEMVSSFAYLLTANIDGDPLRISAKVKKWDVPTFVFDDNKLTVKTTIDNDGNVAIEPTFDTELYDLIAGKVAWQDKANMELLAESVMSKTQNWNDGPFLGVFRAKTDVTLDDKTEHYEKLVFFIPIWLAIVFLGVIGLLTWALVLKIRGHKKAVNSRNSLKFS